MSATATVCGLEQARQAQRDRAAAEYDELLERMEEDGQVDPKRALRVLEQAGKEPADIEAELGRRRRIAQLRETLAGDGELLDRHRQLTAAIDAKKAELEAATKRLNEELMALHKELSDVNRRRFDIDRARKELQRLMPLTADEQERREEHKAICGKVVSVEAMLARKPDPRGHQAEAKRLQGLMDELSAKVKATPRIQIFVREGLKRELSNLTRKRDELLAQHEKYIGLAHLWDQLDAACQRRDELRRQLNQPAAAEA